MKVRVERIANVKRGNRAYCIGRLYISGEYVCDTLEDLDRGLDDDWKLVDIKAKKVYGQTAIPTGTYPLVTNIVSSTFFQKSYYQKYCYGKLPRLLNVKGYSGILIHRGVNEGNSEGCILVGYNTIVGALTDSQKAFEKVYEKIRGKNNVTIEVTRKYNVT